jgi:hypothetical protein
MSSLPLTGGCLCGAVRFEVTEPLVVASYCHCTRCQRRTGGAASAQAFTAPGSLRIHLGEHVLRAYTPSDGAPKVSCSVCGSQLWSLPPGQADVYAIRLGAFDHDPGIRPSYRQYVDFAAAWEPIPDDGLPRYPGRRPPS